ncbi:MAG: apolipoprotein N-acyltransferase [Proteobacteria bacterium]|nr:apolipoprotein N-acyltransferase [Pseudomonadota bacterium]
MPAKVFLTINDSRWEKYKIDFAKIANVAVDFALQNDKMQQIIDKADGERNFKLFSDGGKWYGGRFFGNLGGPFAGIKREVSIVLTNDAEIKKLNKKHRKIDKATNVLSFETGDPEMLGDIFISFDTAMKEVVGARRVAPDGDSRVAPTFVDHATHLIVHGILHLMGYDHLKETDAVAMESTEVKILAKLGIGNPYEESIDNRAESIDKKPKKNKSIIYALCSMLCGVAASFGFAPFYLWPLTIVGIGTAYYLIFASQKSDQVRGRQVGGKRLEVRDKVEHRRKPFSFNLLPLTFYLLPFSFGAGYAAASFWWMLNSIYVVPELAKQFAVWTIPGLIGIALAGGLIFGLPFAMTAAFKMNHWKRPVIFAAAWTFVLWLREWLFTGFPWNPLANIAMPWPTLSNSMALFGALGLTFVLAGLIASASELFQKNKNKLIPFYIFVPLLIIGIGYGYWNQWNSIVLCNACKEWPIIRIVQPAESAMQKASHSREEALANADANVSNLIGLSKSEPAPTQDSVIGKADNGIYPAPASGGRKTPDIIVWPETAYPYLIPTGADGAALTDFSPAKEMGTNVIAGANTFIVPDELHESDRLDNPKFFNSMIVAGADGRIQRIYSKSHLVPFGEYRPFGDIIPTPAQLTPGRGPTLISVATATEIKESTEHRAQSRDFVFAPAICYEIIFSDSLIPRLTTHDSRLTAAQPMAIINITNDTWFGKTPGTYQHLDMARRYAIESGLPIVRADYSGISAFIASDGRIVSSLPVGVPGALDGVVSGEHVTPYRTIGRDWMMAVILLFTIAVALTPTRGSRKKG